MVQTEELWASKWRIVRSEYLKFSFSKIKNVLVIKNHRDYSIVKGPKHKVSRLLIANWYTIILTNWDTCDRDRLIYQTFLRVIIFKC
jgi:hypothetical protein